MSEVVDLATARWRSNIDPNAHAVRAALVQALADLDSGELEADHIIIFHGRHDEAGDLRRGHYQAGSFDTAGMIGLAFAATRALGA